MKRRKGAGGTVQARREEIFCFLFPSFPRAWHRLSFSMRSLSLSLSLSPSFSLSLPNSLRVLERRLPSRRRQCENGPEVDGRRRGRRERLAVGRRARVGRWRRGGTRDGGQASEEALLRGEEPLRVSLRGR